MKRIQREALLLVVVVLLTTPAAIPYVRHFTTRVEGARPTGFVMYDMPYYMANSREHFEGGAFHLTYGNPFSLRYETKRIYFQPLTLLLGATWRLTGLDPGVIFVAFGAIAAMVCVRVAIALYGHIFGLATWAQRLGLVGFLWGGGFLTLAGLIRMRFVHESSLFHYDPFSGFWFLNFGRNLMVLTEAFYHALFLGVILLLLRRRFVGALSLASVLSWSHPFTGIELLLIVVAWAALERWYLENETVPWWMPFAAGGLVLMHMGYYFGVLGQNAEHRALMEQWTLEWLLPRASALLALGLVGIPTLWQLRRWRLAKELLGNPDRRLFAVWFAVAFALVKHEVFLKPIQPLHFDRGYPWMALFCLAGGSALVAAFDRLSRARWPILGWAVASGLLAIVVLDNAAWFGRYLLGRPVGMHLTREQEEVLSTLNDPRYQGAILLTRDLDLGYFATVYTPLRSWASHRYNTPQFQSRLIELDGLLLEGKVLADWRTRPVVIVMSEGKDHHPTPSASANLGSELVLRNARYRVVYSVPTSPTVMPTKSKTLPRPPR